MEESDTKHQLKKSYHFEPWYLLVPFDIFSRKSQELNKNTSKKIHKKSKEKNRAFHRSMVSIGLVVSEIKM